ncbi:ribonuclease H [Trifolium pratense]|uniref:Ribonuclease H n=1 Tax=Trifolium pratense TaxID=57577 RepID=A0A2K3M8B8_TRIPR|nr:ribonuclease H [Trifolium pratense]
MNCLKLNVDAHLQDDGHWGLGMVLRRDDGRCVGAATRVIKGSNDVGLAETAGLKEALNLIQAMELDEVIVEMDAAVIVNAIHNKIFPRNQWGLLARECSRAFDLNNKLSLKWVSREGNHAAHSLARWAFTAPNKWWSNYFPDCINHHTQKDMAFVS